MFIKDFKDNKRIYFKSKSILRFKNFIALQLSPIKVFNHLAFYHLSKKHLFFSCNKTSGFGFIATKNFNTKISFWLEDFYINGRDVYSRHSSTLVKCSKFLRIERQNFLNYNIEQINLFNN